MHTGKMVIFILLLVVAGFAVYGTSLRNGFLVDDALVVEQNPLIRSFSFIPACFSQPFLKFYYRPVTQLTFMLDYQIWKLNPFGYHVTSILLHVINAVLIFILLYQIRESVVLSAMTALLFIVHPINSISVNYASDRGTLLGLAFMIGAIVMFLLALKRGKALFYFMGFLLFLLALLSHENTIVFPFYLACVLLVINTRQGTKKISILIGFSLLVSLGYLLLRMKFFPFPALFPVSGLLSWEALRSFFFMVCKFVSLALVPANICLIRTIEPASILGLRGIVCMASALSVIVLLIIRFRRNAVVLFALAWFSLGIVPLFYMMFSRPEMGKIMQDNWGYGPSVGLIIILGLCLVRLKRYVAKRLWPFLLVSVFLFYAAASNANCALWKDENTYGKYWLAAVPRNPFALNMVGRQHAQAGDLKKAKEYFWRGVDCFRKRKAGVLTNEIIPGQLLGILYTNLAHVSQDEGKIEEAIKYYNNAITIDNYNSEGHFRLAELYAGNNEADKALFHLYESIRINFYNAQAHRLLASLYYRLGNIEKAQEEIRMAVSIGR